MIIKLVNVNVAFFSYEERGNFRHNRFLLLDKSDFLFDGFFVSFSGCTDVVDELFQ